MSFVKGTVLFTDGGWKNIEDISGRDKLLVRNFIGDAEFIQPFAVHKTPYKGEVLTFGTEKWGATVTPDHMMEYVWARKMSNQSLRRSIAKDIVHSDHNRLLRRFRYMNPGNMPNMFFNSFEGTKRRVYINHTDWCLLIVYTLVASQTFRENKKLVLRFQVNKLGEDIGILADILDRLGVNYGITDQYITVSRKNGLAIKLTNYLGSTKRSEMYFPKKFIYNLDSIQRKLVLDEFMRLSMNKINENTWDLTTTGKKFVDSITLLGMLAGYSVTHRISMKKGDTILGKIAKNDSYRISIWVPAQSVTLRRPKMSQYDGQVFSIDLFDGSVYIGGRTPIWMKPK